MLILWCLAARGRALVDTGWLLFTNFTSFFASTGLVSNLFSGSWTLENDTTFGVGDEKFVDVTAVVEAVVFTEDTFEAVETLDEVTDGCTLAETA